MLRISRSIFSRVESEGKRIRIILHFWPNAVVQPITEFISLSFLYIYFVFFSLKVSFIILSLCVSTLTAKRKSSSTF